MADSRGAQVRHIPTAEDGGGEQSTQDGALPPVGRVCCFGFRAGAALSGLKAYPLVPIRRTGAKAPLCQGCHVVEPRVLFFHFFGSVYCFYIIIICFSIHILY